MPFEVLISCPITVVQDMSHDSTVAYVVSKETLRSASDPILQSFATSKSS